MNRSINNIFKKNNYISRSNNKIDGNNNNNINLILILLCKNNKNIDNNINS